MQKFLSIIGTKKAVYIIVGVTVLLIILRGTFGSLPAQPKGWHYQKEGIEWAGGIEWHCIVMNDAALVREVSMAWCDPSDQEVVLSHKLSE